MSDQDPQTAIDYNLYPASARPSGLEVPQPSLSDKLENPDSDRTVMVDDLREAARQLRKLEEENSKLKSELAAFHAAMQRERNPALGQPHTSIQVPHSSGARSIGSQR